MRRLWSEFVDGDDADCWFSGGWLAGDNGRADDYGGEYWDVGDQHLRRAGGSGQPHGFRRSFAAATVHDWFNLLAVVIFLPLELITGAIFGDAGLLAKIAHYLAAFFTSSDSDGMRLWNPIKATTKPLSSGIRDWLTQVGFSTLSTGIVMIILSIAGIVTSVVGLGRLLKRHLRRRLEPAIRKTIGRGPTAGIATGTAVTILVQSSSTTTSMIVPLAGSGVLSLKQVFPFTVGANIGTTITALIAAFGVTDNEQLALQIAFVHLLFNLGAMLIIFGWPTLRKIRFAAAPGSATLPVAVAAWHFSGFSPFFSFCLAAP